MLIGLRNSVVTAERDRLIETSRVYPENGLVNKQNKK